MTRIIILSFAITLLTGGGGLFLLEVQEVEVVEPISDATSAPKELREESKAEYKIRNVQVPILIYHAVRPYQDDDGPLTRQYTVTTPVFEKQLRFLKESGYTSISFKELEDAILREGDLPDKPVLLSFDDGSWTHYAYVFPLMKAFGFTGTFFIFSNALDRAGYMTSSQVLEMKDAGMTIGNHTRYHQFLTRISDEEALEEMRVGKVRLEELLGEPVDVIAYPFGFYDEEILAGAASLGHRMGRTIKEGSIHSAENLLEMDGYQMTNSVSRLIYALNER